MSTTNLRKFSTTIYQDAEGSDNRQVPAAGALCQVYRQGATTYDLSNVTDVPAGVDVSVADVGGIVVGDQVQIDGQGLAMEVLDIFFQDPIWYLKLRAASGFLFVTPDSRFVPTGPSVPDIFADITGTILDTNPAETNSLGFVEFYTNERQFDMLVTHPNVETKLYQDEESGQLYAPRMEYNVLEFQSVQAAIDSVPGNAVLYFPQGEYIPPDANGWIINKSITILGEGSDGFGAQTIFRPFGSEAVGGAPNSKVFWVYPSTQSVIFKNFIIMPINIPTSDGTGDGILFDCSVQQNYHRIEDVQIWQMGRNGVYAVSGTFNECSFRRLFVNGCRRSGIKIADAPDLQLTDCTASENLEAATHISAAGGLMVHSFRTARNGAAADNPAQHFWASCHGFVADGLDMEEFENSTSKIGVWISNCRGGVFENVRIYNPTQITDTIAIQGGTGSRGISVLGGNAAHVHYFIKAATGASVRGWVVQFPGPITITTTCPALISLPQEASNVADATGGHIIFPTMDRSANGDLTENTFIAGISLPKVNGVATIDNPQLTDGWLVYDSAAGTLKLRHGGAWKTGDFV